MKNGEQSHHALRSIYPFFVTVTPSTVRATITLGGSDKFFNPEIYSAYSASVIFGTLFFFVLDDLLIESLRI